MTQDTRWKRFLSNPNQPQSHQPLTLVIWGSIATLIFIVLFCLVWSKTGVQWINYSAHTSFMEIHSYAADKVFVLFSFLGQKVILFPATIIIALYLGLKKNWRAAIHFVCLMVVMAIIAWLSKHITHSVRPMGLIAGPTNFSFPSGHVTFATTFWGFCAYLLAKELPRYIKRWPYIVAIIIVLLVATSRLYLGVHWLTDVLAGIALGCAGLCFTIINYQRKKIIPIVKSQFLICLILTFIILAAAYGWKNYSKHLHNYQPIIQLEPSIVLPPQ